MIRIYDYAIDADRWQYVVGKPVFVRRKDGTTKEEIRDASYVKTLGEAVTAVYRAKMREVVQTEDLDFAAACKRIREIDEEFRELVKKAIVDAAPEDLELPSARDGEEEMQ